MRYLTLAICLFGMFGCACFRNTETLAKNTREVVLLDKCIEGVHQQTGNILNDANLFQNGVLERRMAAVNNVCFCTSETAISYRSTVVEMLSSIKEVGDVILLAAKEGRLEDSKVVERLKALDKKVYRLGVSIVNKEDALRAEQRSLLMREF